MEGRTVSGRRRRGGRRCGGTTSENSIAATRRKIFWKSRAGTRTNGVLLGCPSANVGARAYLARTKVSLRRLGSTSRSSGASFDAFFDFFTIAAPTGIGTGHALLQSRLTVNAPGRRGCRRLEPCSTLPPADLFESHGTSPLLPRGLTRSWATALLLRRSRRRPGSFTLRAFMRCSRRETPAVPDDGRRVVRFRPRRRWGRRRRRATDGDRKVELDEDSRRCSRTSSARPSTT